MEQSKYSQIKIHAELIMYMLPDNQALPEILV